MHELIDAVNQHNDKKKLMILRCHKELDGTIGTYPYSQISDEIQEIIQDHGIGDVEVYRLEPGKISTASNRRSLPGGKEVWLHREYAAPWKPTDTMFSFTYPYNWGELLFQKICCYFASIPDLNGRWDAKIVDKEIQENWKISANEETYEFLLDHWEKVPNCEHVILSECPAEQVKELLLVAYDMRQRARNTELKPHKPLRQKWLYVEEGKVIQDFEVQSELAQYIYTSDKPKDGLAKLVYVDDLLKEDVPTGVDKTAKQFLAQYEQFHPLFPPRDTGVQVRLREPRFILEGERCTAKDLWERCYRSQIDRHIRSGTESHIAALVLMMPCMELVHKLKAGKRTNWIDTLKLFFPADGFDQNTYKGLANLIRNGFVHDGFAKGDVGISSADHTPEEYSDGQQVFVGTRSETGRFHLLIIPAYFWARVRNKIDSFYEHEQWIPGWDMHQVITISNYVEPLTGEELT
ncbi:MAG: hypothetical protein OXF63_10225 [Anaerolineaceae bacterium]|nr:hypothetical protein [Anaerolineaceae bacterium]